MKFRNGFVSNSSSSSFVCDICGRTETGMDIGLRDAEMRECVHGHTFCESEMITQIPDKYLDEESPEYDEDIEYGYYTPEECCPICTFSVYSESDMVEYLKRKFGDDTTEAFAEVKTMNSRRKKLYDSEYVFFACKKNNTNVDEQFQLIKDTFATYTNFRDWLRK